MNQGEREYGHREDQIHSFFEEKRTWSKVKDKILEDYVTCYLRTIHRRGRPIVIVDAFSGPGRFGDGSPGSPLIICRAIDNAPRRGVGLACIFSDSHPAHRVALEDRLARYIDQGVAERPLTEFSEALTSALKVGKGSTLFFYLDPYGIKELDFEMIRQICQRDPSQSTEVLINFSFPTFMRMSGNWSYGDSAPDVARKVKEAKVETLNAVMDGDYWQEIVTDPRLNKLQREDRVVGEYMERVREFFEYTYSVPVKERTDQEGSIPTDELAKYHLIFGTRSARAVVYMNDVALNALEPYFNQFKDGLLFDMIPARYEASPRDEVKEEIVELVNARPMTRPEIYEAIIPGHFMERRKKDYRAFIDELTFEEGRLFPDRSTMKLRNRLNDETLLSTKPIQGGGGL